MAVIEEVVRVGKRIDNKISVCTGELVALAVVLQWVEDTGIGRALICSATGIVQGSGVKLFFMGTSTYWDYRKRNGRQNCFKKKSDKERRY